MRRSLVLLMLVACHHGASEDEGDDKPAPAVVTCQPVAPAEISDTIDVSGVVAPPPKLDAVVSSPVAGRVGQVAVEEGDAVAAGALLAVIEDPALPAGSIEAKAAVAAAEAAKAAAELELGRQQRLVDAGIGARKDLDDAKAKAASAAAELDAAMARAGLAKLSDGLAATVEVIGLPGTLPASVARVAPAVDPTTLLGNVRVAISGDTKGIKVGSAARARIVIARRAGVIVPETALRRSIVGTDQVVMCAGGKAKIAEVTVGQRTSKGVEIASGLAAGSQIVVDHVLGLDDGQELVAGKGSAR